MIRVTATPRTREDLYGLLIKKELDLRRKGQGTLHRQGGKKREVKWVHRSHNGWIRFQKCLSGMVVAVVQARNSGDEWQLLTSFIGFLDRHFRDKISSINIGYESE